MKLKNMACPNCGGSIDMKIDDNTSSVFCPYCEQTLYVDREKKEFTINNNITIDKKIHRRYTNDAEVIRAKTEANETKSALIALGWIWGALIAFGLLVALIIHLSVVIPKSQGKINAGTYSDLVGKDYKIVEAHFEAAGFTDIELIDLNDAGIAFWNNGKVAFISIGGDSNFKSSDWFEADTKVVISYH